VSKITQWRWELNLVTLFELVAECQGEARSKLFGTVKTSGTIDFTVRYVLGPQSFPCKTGVVSVCWYFSGP